MPPSDAIETYRPNSGRIMGWLAVALAGVLPVLALFDPQNMHPAVVAGSVLFGLLAWSSMLRPRLQLTSDALVLRGMIDTVHIPLAAIEELAVRRVLAVRVGGPKRFTSPVLSRTLRQLHRPPPKNDADRTRRREAPGVVNYVDHVESRIRSACQNARDRAGVRHLSDEQEALAVGVRREPAWSVIVPLVGTVIVFLGSLFL